MKHLLKCPKCHLYTLEGACPSCRTKTFPPKPPRFSPQDKYGEYRREQKKPILEEQGLY